MNTTEELFRLAVAVPEDKVADALSVLRGQAVAVDVNAASNEPYLSLKELAKHFCMHSCTLWRWRIPGHDIGGHRRYRISEVAAYLRSKEFKRLTAALRAERRNPMSARHPLKPQSENP